MVIVYPIVAALFSCMAAVIMSYISLATPIGPWVELIVVLCATMFFRVFLRYRSTNKIKHGVGLATVAGGVSGIVATVCGFFFPTLYFLDPVLFNSWVASPLYFMVVMAGLIVMGGGFAFIVVHCVQDRMLNDDSMSFPIGKMVARMMDAQNQLRKSIELCTGFLATLLFGFLERCVGLIPKSITIFPALSWGIFHIPHLAIRLSVLPIFIAIGYVGGHILALPLIVGVVSKLFILTPLKKMWFAHISFSNFILAFGSGMILQGAFMSFLRLPQVLVGVFKKMKGNGSLFRATWNHFGDLRIIVSVLLFFVYAILFLTYFGFSFLAQLYLFVFGVICVYQLILIGGKIGLAPMGRFATFVLLPGLFMFGFDSIQITFVSFFIALSGGLAVDLMFGRKMGQIAHIERKTIVMYQILGLVVSALTVGFIFYLLISHFGLGSDELAAQRAQSRALLMNAFGFDYGVLIIGALYGALLHKFRIDGVLVFTGLLFRVDYALMLIAGGLLAYVPQDKEDWDPFWSGVFAAGSLWMLLRIFC